VAFRSSLPLSAIIILFQGYSTRQLDWIENWQVLNEEGLAQRFEITETALYFASLWSNSTRMVFLDRGIITKMLLTWTWSETNTLCRKCDVLVASSHGPWKVNKSKRIIRTKLLGQWFYPARSLLYDETAQVQVTLTWGQEWSQEERQRSADYPSGYPKSHIQAVIIHVGRIYLREKI